MYFLALATDFDGTIARDGVVRPETVAALRRLKKTDRRLLLVTGRELPAVLSLLPDPTLFDRIVAENGALIHDPLAGTERLLAAPPPPAFVQRLRERRVAPLSVGRCILGTWEPHQTTVLEAIHDLGLELQISFNKGAVMVLPSGVNKAAGLQAALAELGIAMPNVVGVGDAENDHSFLRACGCSAAVSNALPMVRRDADLTVGDHGAGVEELIDRVIERDVDLAPPAKHGPWLGRDRGGEKLYLRPGEGCALVLGSSGVGKSTLATALTERLAAGALEFCVIDPEGDYVDLKGAVRIGSPEAPPSATEALRLVSRAGVNVVVNTQAIAVDARRALFTTLLHQAAHLRARTGRPHWLLIDEAHELLPGPTHHSLLALLDQDLTATILITLAPSALSREALSAVGLVLALGPDPAELIRDAAGLIGRAAPDCPETRGGEALCWRLESGEPPVPLRLEPPEQDHRRHAGKYAVGDVGEQRSFYFHDLRQGRFVRARNLYEFLDESCMVDDQSWERHLRSGDFSAWFRHVIRDDDLAQEAAQVEADRALSIAESRRLIRKVIWRRYAAPAQCS